VLFWRSCWSRISHAFHTAYKCLSKARIRLISLMREPPLFVDTPMPSPITEFVCQVTSNVNGDDHYASGTAVIIAPNLAFSAKHVFDEHWMRHEGRRPPVDGEGAGRFSLVLAQLVGNQLNLWAVTRLWTSQLTDIVVLRLTPMSSGAQEYTFRRMALDLLPPTVGERISAFGYHSNTVDVGDREITLRQAAGTTHGDVLEVHHQYRDAVRLNFPCFRTNARFDGGMSGGPVFNRGHLCGVICSALPPATGDEEYASYVASLWPAMAIVIDLDRVRHPRGVRYPLIELVRDDTIAALNADRVTVGELPATGTPTISFTAP